MNGEKRDRTIYRRGTMIVILTLLLIGFLLLIFGNSLDHESWQHNLVRDLGITALISGILGSAYEYWLRKDFNEAAEHSLRKVLRKDKSEWDQARQMCESGVLCIYEDRQTAKMAIANEVSPKEKIQILETWTGERNSLKWLADAVKGGCQAQILLLNPTSRQVWYRDQAMGGHDYVKGEIEDDLKELERLRKKLKQEKAGGKLELKVYDATPVLHMFRFDDIWITGMYFNQDSTWSPHFKVVRPSRSESVNQRNSPHSIVDFADMLEKHFNALWTHQRTKSAWKVLEDLQHKRAASGAVSASAESSSLEGP